MKHTKQQEDRGISILKELNSMIDTWKRLDVDYNHIHDVKLKLVMQSKQNKTFDKIKNSVSWIHLNLDSDALLNLLENPDNYFEHEQHIELFLSDSRFKHGTMH